MLLLCCQIYPVFTQVFWTLIKLINLFIYLISCILQLVPMGAPWMYQLMEPLHKELPGLQLVALQCHSLDTSVQSRGPWDYCQCMVLLWIAVRLFTANKRRCAKLFMRGVSMLRNHTYPSGLHCVQCAVLDHRPYRLDLPLCWYTHCSSRGPSPGVFVIFAPQHRLGPFVTTSALSSLTTPK
jgi:hypothetical protein